jgi:hypothetical protein
MLNTASEELYVTGSTERHIGLCQASAITGPLLEVTQQDRAAHSINHPQSHPDANEDAASFLPTCRRDRTEYVCGDTCSYPTVMRSLRSISLEPVE